MKERGRIQRFLGGWMKSRHIRRSRRIGCLEEFHEVLRRERARSDRYGVEFSLILFNVPAANADIIVDRIVASIAGRVRSTDKVGWYSRDSVGILLPHATFESARKVADAVIEMSRQDLRRSDYTIYTYPHTIPEDWTHPDGNHRINDFTPKETVPGRADTFQSAGSVDVRRVPLAPARETVRSSLDQFASAESVFAARTPIWKRTVDIVVSLLCFVILSPVFLAAALLIKSVSRGPVFFKQERLGQGGKRFTMWKFRTMYANADASVHKEYTQDLISSDDTTRGQGKVTRKLPDDARIIPFGKVLRASFLDELPQLINVLRGNMSLVGPRPCLPYEAERFAPWHYERLAAVPGMTGLWQVSGKHTTTFNEMVRLDITYARQKSFGIDLTILLLTPIVIVLNVIGSVTAVHGS